MTYRPSESVEIGTFTPLEREVSRVLSDWEGELIDDSITDLSRRLIRLIREQPE